MLFEKLLLAPTSEIVFIERPLLIDYAVCGVIELDEFVEILGATTSADGETKHVVIPFHTTVRTAMGADSGGCASNWLLLKNVSQLCRLYATQVLGLEVDDARALLELQDLFALEHLELTRAIYPQVTLRDWQLCLLCPLHILEKPNGRIEHVQSMVRKDQECFDNLTILKATVGHSNGHPAQMVGYIMFQTFKGSRSKRRSPHESPWPSVQVKQIFVRQAHRKLGCGKFLLDSMLEDILIKAQDDVNLSVLDLNEAATRWYRSQGFVISGISKDFLGTREDANVIVYQAMQRLQGKPREKAALKGKGPPNMFRADVLQEDIRIVYPDGSGTFDVKIVDFIEKGKDRLHAVDSAGLSLWDGETFTDQIDLNDFFRAGHVHFLRHLSLVMRDAELNKKLARQEKAQLRQHELEEIAAQAHARRSRPESLEDLDKRRRSKVARLVD
ncbi:unnamed protein product [Polarella glacialis]|uniref:N-acetyltransferase domain-containing protein n=1 Tax=Polarella glacialis TaxID=89957 RepID=A0A813GLW5_POLGL|nr:unnamed protein product [Polarella glacialis]